MVTVLTPISGGAGLGGGAAAARKRKASGRRIDQAGHRVGFSPLSRRVCGGSWERGRG
jgi:hypothetical protein